MPRPTAWAGTIRSSPGWPARGHRRFTLTNLAPTIALTVPAGPILIGQAATITATIINADGRPLAGIPVSFSIIAATSAVGTADPADGRTDANGQVRFTYLGAGNPGPTRSSPPPS